MFSDQARVGTSLLTLGASGSGITGWSLSSSAASRLIERSEGIAARTVNFDSSTQQPAAHPNGAYEIDHVVLISPNLPRTLTTLHAAGLQLRRTREVSPTRHQCFYRLGDVVLEVVGDPNQALDSQSELWGLIFTVADLDATCDSMPEMLSDPKPAVQPGRRITTVKRSAGLSVPCGFLSPHTSPRNEMLPQVTPCPE